MVAVSVVGVRGYAGGELVRLLLGHPDVEIRGLYGREAGEVGRVGEILPHLDGFRMPVQPVQALAEDEAEIVFLSVPAEPAQQMVPPLLARGKKVIDLSGGHRLPPGLYPSWYGLTPDALPPAVYGLTEFARDLLPQAELVANPGCFATALLLGLVPLAQRDLIGPDVFAVGYSGISGAGRTPRFGGLSELAESIQPYRPFTHQHTPEVESGVAAFAGHGIALHFLPHVAPIVRGILITMFVDAQVTPTELQKAFEERYADEPFVRVLSGQLPDVKRVRGTNRAEVAVAGQRGGRAAIYVAIDNLGKGAAGQALQNLNVILGLPESVGLEYAVVWP